MSSSFDSSAAQVEFSGASKCLVSATALENTVKDQRWHQGGQSPDGSVNQRYGLLMCTGLLLHSAQTDNVTIIVFDNRMG